MTPPDAYTQAVPPALSLPNPGRADLRGFLAEGLARLFDERSWPRHRMLLDLLLLCIASAVALFASASMPGVAHDRFLVGLFPFVALCALHGRRTADRRIDASPIDAGFQAIGAVSIAAMVMLALAGALSRGPGVIELTLRLWLFGAVYLGGGRATLQWARHEAQAAGLVGTPTLIVGAGLVGSHVARRLESEPSYGLRPVGFLDADPLPSQGLRLRTPVLGGAGDLAEVVRSTGARRVILAFSAAPDSQLVEEVRECERLGVEVSLVPRMFEEINQRTRLEHIGGVPLLSLEATDPYGWQFAVKHAFDRLTALVVLLLLSPVLIGIALAVRLTSPGPILFRQRRVGRDGNEFDLLKFRSMRTEQDAGGFQPLAGSAPGGIEGVDRRTPIGRFLRGSSLDELPQLINVLRGDMSLVGPRPERPEYVELFTRDINRYGDRHRVKSGITGWAQVNGLRGQTSIADRVEWDNHYIANWSLWFDLRILAQTAFEVLKFHPDA